MKRPDDLLNWLDGLFSALELEEPFQLMGLSYGGWLTSRYALRFPDRLDRTVLLAPACTVLPIRLQWFARAVLCALPHRFFTRNFMCWLLEDLARRDGAGRALVEEWADNAFLSMRSFKRRRVVPPTVLKDAELQAMNVPALFLVGENEKIYSAQKAVQRLNRVAPHIRTEILPGAGHDLTLVQAEVVNSKVLDFLQGP